MSLCELFYKSCLLLWVLGRHKPGIQRQRDLRTNFPLSTNGIFAAERSIKSLGGQRYTGEGSWLKGNLFKKEMITRSPSRHSNRSSVLTGELGREKNNSHVWWPQRTDYWHFSIGYERVIDIQSCLVFCLFLFLGIPIHL